MVFKVAGNLQTLIFNMSLKFKWTQKDFERKGKICPMWQRHGWFQTVPELVMWSGDIKVDSIQSVPTQTGLFNSFYSHEW